MKRSALKRGRPKPKPSMAEFWEAVTANGTAPCALAHRGDCDGQLDAHHVFKAQRLRRRVSQWRYTRLYDEKELARREKEMLGDPANGQPLCRFHHAQVEGCRLVCPTPAGFEGFLERWGLVAESWGDRETTAAFAHGPYGAEGTGSGSRHPEGTA